MRSAKILYQSKLAGILSEDDTGYRFVYDDDYLQDNKAAAVSLSLTYFPQDFISRIFLQSYAFFCNITPFRVYFYDYFTFLYPFRYNSPQGLKIYTLSGIITRNKTSHTSKKQGDKLIIENRENPLHR